MVRLKNRYLLVHILYPSSSNETTTKQTPSTTIPNVVRFHQPTSDALTPHLLTRTIRSEIASLYGDYGAGVTSSSLSSERESTGSLDKPSCFCEELRNQ